jgi:hypothetical protein
MQRQREEEERLKREALARQIADERALQNRSEKERLSREAQEREQ